jgi:hypothetical protein
MTETSQATSRSSTHTACRMDALHGSLTHDNGSFALRFRICAGLSVENSLERKHSGGVPRKVALTKTVHTVAMGT